MSLDELRALALALLVDEGRLLERLDDEARKALGMRARRGRLRVDDLSCRLMHLIDGSDLWRRRAEAARGRVTRSIRRVRMARGVACA